MSLKSYMEWIALTFLIIFLLRKHLQISPDKTYFTPEVYLLSIIETKIELSHTHTLVKQAAQEQNHKC